MACQHRFLDHPNLKNLLPVWEFEYIFIGTFNPSWTFPTGQSAAYFYGRTKNNYFWDLLPDIWINQKMRNESSSVWEHFLKENRIGVTDLIQEVTDAEESNEQHITWLKDKADSGLVKFKQIVWNTSEILTLINNNEKKLKGIFITNQTAPAILNNQINLIQQAAIQNNIVFERLLTPSGGARFQIPKGSKLYPTLLADWKRKIDPIRLKS